RIDGAIEGLVAIGIHADRDLLAWMNMRHLRLLQVGSHPYLVQRNEGEHSLSNRELLSWFHRAPGDHCVGRSPKLCVAKVEQGLVERCLCLLNISEGGLVIGFSH